MTDLAALTTASREQAGAVAAAAMDDLEAHVDGVVGDIFESFGNAECISLERWLGAARSAEAALAHSAQPSSSGTAVPIVGR